MNIVKLQDDLKNVPDNALINYVQNPSGQVPTYLALSELQRRKKMREQASGAQAQGPQPSVAEQLVAESAPQAGIAGIPVTNIGNEDAYATGGIVSFAEGGDVQGYATKGFVELTDEELRRLSPAEQVDYNNRKYAASRQDILSGAKKIGAAGLDVLTLPGRALYNAASDIFSAKGELLNRFAGRQLVDTAPAPGYTSMTPFYDMWIRGNPENADQQAPVQTAQTTPAVVDNTYIDQLLAQQNKNIIANDTGSQFKTPPAGPRPPAAPSTAPTGLQTLVAPKMEYVPMAEADRTPLVDARGEMDKYMGLIGEDPYATKAAERISKMEQANELYKQQFPWLALAEAGFGMAAGTSPFALQNIAEGGQRGVTALARGRKEVDEQEEKIFNAEAKVAEAKRAVQLSAAKYGLDSEQTAKAARRLENAEERKAQRELEFRNKTFEFETKKFSIEEARKQRELTAEIENKQALARYYNKTPAEIQLIERYAADKKIPFSQAFEEVQYGKNEPKTDSAIAAKLLTANPMLAEDSEALAKAVQNYKAGMSGYNPAQWGTPKQISK